MPQLMPLFWYSSLFFAFFGLFVLMDLYFYMLFSFMNENKTMNVNFNLWLW